MENNLPTNFTNLLLALQYKKTYQKAIQIALDKYNLRQSNIEDLTPYKILELYRTVVKKFYMNRTRIIEGSWFQNQLRVYLWLLVGYVFIHKKHIKQMTNDDWQYFSSIFHQRLPITFQFQSLSLLPIQKSSKWQNQQMELLQSLIKQKKFKNKWNSIARQLFIRSNKMYYRNPKQCRERWLNYLDPNKKKTGWQTYQDLLLLKSIQQMGKKWSCIVRILKQTRTQHMVKNRYKSLVSNQMRKYPKYTQNQIVLKLIKQYETQMSEIMVKSQHLPQNNQMTFSKLGLMSNGDNSTESYLMVGGNNGGYHSSIKNTNLNNNMYCNKQLPKTSTQYIVQTPPTSVPPSYMTFLKSNQPAFYIPNNINMFSNLRMMNFSANKNSNSPVPNQIMQPYHHHPMNVKSKGSLGSQLNNSGYHINNNDDNEFLMSHQDLDNYMLFQGKDKESLLSMNMKDELILAEEKCQMMNEANQYLDKGEKINYFSEEFHHDCFR